MTPNQPLHDGDRPRSGAGLFARKGLIRRALRYGGMIVILCVAILVAGFLVFADSVTGMRPPETVKADAIVVLTGGYQRIEQAIDLLKRGYGERLLISGVNPATTPGQIRKAIERRAGCIRMLRRHRLRRYRYDRQRQRDGDLDPRQGLSFGSGGDEQLSPCP